ncbi:copper transporter [Nocardia huaxiensis]|uniref:Copper transporter n=1 Tax=Nocardia huaxiensis TaxID=2755382 RepID=A0A7D6VNF3_9NOCA|nr:copper transporter [Nocardia huaxiensis]QLY33896.1 copper transporter [Nocardia huaxiensis]UFS99173.1 copper transporter [Nocardia huaxiensis]
MISIRQHAISLAAVFLALAVGVVLGTRTHGDGLFPGTGETAKIDQLTAENARLSEQVKAADSFLAGAAGKLLTGSLANRTVLVFTTPDVDTADADAVTAALTTAGATVTGRVGLTGAFTDSSEADRLRTTLLNIVPAGAVLKPDAADQGSLAGDLLGQALLADPVSGQPRGTDQERGLALETLRGGGFLTFGDVKPAQLAVVVTGDGAKADENNRGTIAARFAGGLRAHSAGVVLTGRHGAAEGAGPIAVVRSEAALATVTTVDNVDHEIGRITTVLGLTEQLNGGTGRYGTGAKATSLTVAAMPR